MKARDLEDKQPCVCTQAARDLLNAVSPIKDGMPKEVKFKGCEKTFLTNFDVERCYDCRRKNQQG